MEELEVEYGEDEGELPLLPSPAVRLQNAIEGIKQDEFQSISEAAVAYAINYFTLYHRVKGVRKPRSEAFRQLQKLDEIQEEVICDQIIRWVEYGFPPNITMLKEAANLLYQRKCQQMGIEFEPVGTNWHIKFLKRHPEFKQKWETFIEKKRRLQAQPRIILPFIDLFKHTMEKYRIHHEDIWNVDEKGFRMGIPSQKEKVIMPRSYIRTRQSHTTGSDNREWATTIECCGVNGKHLSPYIIFKGKRIHSGWPRHSTDPNTQIAVSEKGYSDGQHALEWLQRIFIPQTNTSRMTRAGKKIDQPPRLLLIDGHESHLSFNFIQICWENQIIPICMPPHTSRLLQPLDIGVFSPLSQAYSTEIKKRIRTGHVNITKEVFLDSLFSARSRAITPTQIAAGWRTSGLWPINPKAVTKHAKWSAEEVDTTSPSPASVTPGLSFENPISEEECLSYFSKMQEASPTTRARYEKHLTHLLVGKSNSITLLQNSYHQLLNTTIASKNQRSQRAEGKFEPSLGRVCSLDEALKAREAWEIKKNKKDEKAKAVQARKLERERKTKEEQKRETQATRNSTVNTPKMKTSQSSLPTSLSNYPSYLSSTPAPAALPLPLPQMPPPQRSASYLVNHFSQWEREMTTFAEINRKRRFEAEEGSQSTVDLERYSHIQTPRRPAVYPFPSSLYSTLRLDNHPYAPTPRRLPVPTTPANLGYGNSFGFMLDNETSVEKEWVEETLQRPSYTAKRRRQNKLENLDNDPNFRYI